jgi:hypothetical protein
MPLVFGDPDSIRKRDAAAKTKGIARMHRLHGVRSDASCGDCVYLVANRRRRAILSGHASLSCAGVWPLPCRMPVVQSENRRYGSGTARRSEKRHGPLQN